MKNHISNSYDEFKKLSIPLKISVFIFPLIMIILTTVLIARTKTATELKLEPNKKLYEEQAKSAAELANEIIRDLKQKPVSELPVEFREVFSHIDFGPILSEIEFDKLDMNIGFNFTTNEYDQALLSSEINYGVGEYRMTPNVALVIIRVFELSLKDRLLKLLGKCKLETKILGIADGIPVKDDAIYRGMKIDNQDYYYVNTGTWKKMTLIPNHSSLGNEKFAFLRAFYAYQHFKDINLFRNFPVEIHAKEVKEIGQRKTIIGIQISIKDILEDDYKKLNFLEKRVFDLFGN